LKSKYILQLSPRKGCQVPISGTESEDKASGERILHQIFAEKIVGLAVAQFRCFERKLLSWRNVIMGKFPQRVELLFFLSRCANKS